MREYTLKEDDPKHLGITGLGLVKDPSHKSNGVFDTDDNMFRGIFVKAGVPFKHKKSGGELAKIGADTIKKMKDRFHQTGADKKITINHEREDGKPIYQDDCYVAESYQVKNEHDIHSLRKQGLKDADVGDWILGVKVSDEVRKMDIESGDVQGLSLEGNLAYKEIANIEFDHEIAKAHRLAKELFNNMKS